MLMIGNFIGKATKASSNARLKLLKKLAPQVGLEPTTLRLTAECSAIELLRNVTFRALFCVHQISANDFYTIAFFILQLCHSSFVKKCRCFDFKLFIFSFVLGRDTRANRRR